jgi:hypothetical protein
MTGEDLRESADATLWARLSRSGPLPITGLQGVGAWQSRPRNAPPLDSYFVSYADGPPDGAARGHMGHIAILRLCEAAIHAGAAPPALAAATLPAGALFPGGPPQPASPPAAPPGGPPPPLTPPHVRTPPPPPPGACLSDAVRRVPGGECAPSCPPPDIQIGRRCCAVATLAANGECSNAQCPAGQTAVGPSNFAATRAGFILVPAARSPAARARSSTANILRPNLPLARLGALRPPSVRVRAAMFRQAAPAASRVRSPRPGSAVRPERCLRAPTRMNACRSFTSRMDRFAAPPASSRRRGGHAARPRM